jgi:hypothetical protein
MVECNRTDEEVITKKHNNGRHDNNNSKKKMKRTIPIQKYLQRTRKESQATIETIQYHCKKKEAIEMGQRHRTHANKIKITTTMTPTDKNEE